MFLIKSWREVVCWSDLRWRRKWVEVDMRVGCGEVRGGFWVVG